MYAVTILKEYGAYWIYKTGLKLDAVIMPKEDHSVLIIDDSVLRCTGVNDAFLLYNKRRKAKRNGKEG